MKPEIDLTALLDLYAGVTSGTCKPELVVCDARSEQGQYILAHRDGETDFDGFHHAYIRRDGQTFLVPLHEWVEGADEARD